MRPSFDWRSGIALAVDGKFSQALKQFNEAIYLCPTPELFEMKAQALMETFQYFPAIQAAEMVFCSPLALSICIIL